MAMTNFPRWLCLLRQLAGTLLTLLVDALRWKSRPGRPPLPVELRPLSAAWPGTIPRGAGTVTHI
jgi:hypothetical protein